MKLIVGLGNPGSKYEGTRHNIGFMVARRLAEQLGVALKRQGHQGIYGVGRIEGIETMILLPQTFMNVSGASVSSAYKSLGVPPGDLIVIHDDIDLPFSRLRLRVGGGHGGHNGIRNIATTLGTGDFCRLKIGIGRPQSGEVADYVLGNFDATERRQLPELLDLAVQVIKTIATHGSAAAMNEFNNQQVLS
ncbi:MAG: aminoacyl-tRNA hydrolase [Desulfuromonadales bacterium]|nr:aminoacyl-tRNA hydrolase [Desulfuromonadales bacterium]